MTEDYLGRTNNASMSVNDLRQMLSDATNTPIFTDSSTNQDEIYKQLQEDVAKLSRKLGRVNDNTESFAQAVIDLNNQRKEEKKSSKHHLEIISEATQNLWKASQSHNTLWFGLSKITTRAQKQIASAIRAALGTTGASAAATAATTAATTAAATAITQNLPNNYGAGVIHAGAGGVYTPSPPATPAAAATPAVTTPITVPSVTYLQRAAHLSGVVLGHFVALHQIMTKATNTDFMGNVFSGTLSASNLFLENIRAIVHQTQGFGADNREIEKSFINIAKATDAAGTSYGAFAAQHTKNLQKGLELNTADEKEWSSKFKGLLKYDKLRERSAQKLMSITTTALSTAQSLNMEISSINDLFMDWHLHLSMSSLEIAEIGQGMAEIARNTGVTGKQLESAVKNTDKIMRALKSAGNVTSTSAKNIMQLQASMEKYGMGEKNTEMMGALTSRHDFMNASSEIKSMLSRIAFAGGPDLIDAVQTGEVLSNKSNTKKFGKAFEADTQSFLSNFAGDFQRLGVQMPTDMKDLSKAMQQLRDTGSQGKFVAANIDTLSRKRYSGRGIGDLEQIFKGFEENSKTTSDRINDTIKKLKEMENAGETKLDEYKRLKKILIETETDQSLSAFRVMQQQLKDNNVKDFNAASSVVKEKIVKVLSDEMGVDKAKSFTENLGKSAQEMMKGFAERAGIEGKSLDKLLKERGTSREEIQKSLEKGGPDRAKALEDMTAAVQEIKKRERTAQDPITEIKRILTEWNTTLSSLFGWMKSKMGHFTTQVIYWLGAIAATLINILIAVSAWKGLQYLHGLIKGGTAAQTAVSSTGIVSNSWQFITRTFSSGWNAVVSSFSPTGFIGKSFISIRTAFSSSGWIGKMFSSMGSMLGGKSGFLGRTFSSIAGMFSSSGWIGRMFGSIGRFFTSGGILKVAGKIAAPLALAMGGFSGWKESESAGRTQGEGVLLGALTGGAKTGSWLSDYLGIEKGGTADKAVGVGSAALWGAGIGLALAPFTGGISVIVGALIGGAIEIVKILTQGTDIIQKYFVAPFMVLINNLKTVLVGIWDIIAGIFTLDLGRIVKGISGIISGVINLLYDAIVGLLSTVLNALITTPQLLWKGLKWVLLEMPKMIIDSILSSLRDLAANNEYLAPIIAPFFEFFEAVEEAFKPFYESMKSIFEAIEPIFDEARKMIESIIGPLSGANKEGGIFKNVMWAIGGTIKIVSQIIGAVITIMIAPLVLFAKLIGGLTKTFKLAVDAIKKFPFLEWIIYFCDKIIATFKGIVDWAKWLFDVLLGHSIIPDLVTGIVKWFAKLPILILKGLANLGITIATFIKDSILQGLDYIKKIPEKVIEKTKEATQTIANASQETAEMSEKRIAESGSSFISGGGRAAGGLIDLVTGSNEGRMGGVKKMIGGTFEVAKSILDPFNWFKEGTREVEQGGLGVLHQGEMVVPKDSWDQIKATGSEAFGDGGNFSSYIKKLFDFVLSLQNMQKSPESIVEKTNNFSSSGVNNKAKTIINFAQDFLGSVIKGIFNNIKFSRDFVGNQVSNFFGKETNTIEKPTHESSLVTAGDSVQNAIDKYVSLGKPVIANQKNEGLFDPLENIAEAIQKSVNTTAGLGEMLGSAIDSRVQEAIPGIVAQLSDSLNYEKQGSEAAELFLEKQAKLFGEDVRGEISSNLMDYRDEMKGEVNTLGRDRTGIESEIEKRKYGDSGSSQLISGIDSVNEYLLNKQSGFFEEMIDLLYNIRENTKPTTTTFSGGSRVVGNTPSNNLSLTKTNINHYSSSFIKGLWDLSLGDMSPGAVITDGRGGGG